MHVVYSPLSTIGDNGSDRVQEQETKSSERPH